MSKSKTTFNGSCGDLSTLEGLYSVICCSRTVLALFKPNFGQCGSCVVYEYLQHVSLQAKGCATSYLQLFMFDI